MPKTKHQFGKETTVAKFREVVSQEFLDIPHVPKGTRIYVRKYGVGCWNPASITVEDSGVYIEAGEESNPQ